MRFILAFFIILFSATSTYAADVYADGTVVVWENGSNLGPVQRHTGSNKTHAGIVLYEGKQAWVYEASRPNVHRYTIEQYIKRIEDAHKTLPNLGVYFLQPEKPYTANQLHKMKQYANSQIGRPFGIQSYMLGRPMQTVHCCEYVGHILEQSGRFKALGPRETPKTIFDKASKL